MAAETPGRSRLVLALDSAGSACSAAVAAGATVSGCRAASPALHGQAERLLPMVDTVMRQAGVPPAALDRGSRRRWGRAASPASASGSPQPAE